MAGLVSLAGGGGKEVDAVLGHLEAEDVLGQLLERRGTMAQRATEADDVKLDWADGIAWDLNHPEVLEDIERRVFSIRERGIRHVVWSGMGGSIQTVHAMKRMGLLEGAAVTVHPLDSTDPAALNRLLRRLCGGDGVPLTRGSLAAALQHTMAIGVSMGMTSEEPITHLQWFEGLLREHGVTDFADRLLVMTLPESFLDRFARERGAPTLPIQLNGENHTPSRMSAPSTRVFLLPAAFALNGDPGRLQRLLERCQAEYRLGPELAPSQRAELVRRDPFIRLAAWLTVQATEGRNKLILALPPAYLGLGPWIEQVVEESLGKGGKGFLVFYDQDLAHAGGWPDEYALLQVAETGRAAEPPADVDRLIRAGRPSARLEGAAFPKDDLAGRLGLLARLFAGWNLAVAVLGYLNGITFAGQPAVEPYKRYARALRESSGPLPYPEAAGDSGQTPAAALVEAAGRLRDQGRLGYLEVTLNAEPEGVLWNTVRSEGRSFANNVLCRPVKIRSGPRDYHSTEQSVMDGPNEVLSLRLLVLSPEPVAAGTYSHRFLHAQALGTLRAMRDAGRPAVFATIPTAGDGALVIDLFRSAARQLAASAIHR